MIRTKDASDEPFHNFRASRSGDGRILCNSETSRDGFSSKIVKYFVGAYRKRLQEDNKESIKCRKYMTHTFENNTFSSYIDCFCGECKISSSQLNYNCYKAFKIPSSLKVRARKRGKGQKKNKTGRK